MPYDKEKQIVAKEAVKIVHPGMLIGIGSGSTAAYFIQALLERLQVDPFPLTCAPTSLASQKLIGNLIPFVDDALPQEIDITFDGADRIDLSTFHLIKGGGGALLREKLVASRSKRNVILVDSSKLTTPLSGFPIALEIVPFGYTSTIQRLQKLGYQGTLRTHLNRPLLSDNHNYTYDITLKGPLQNPHKHHDTLKGTLGVIETGLFLDTATTAYIAYPDGTIQIKERP